MDIENLVTMANQIGAFYESMPDRKQALADISSHIRKYWEPRMRRELMEHFDEQAVSSEFSPIVLESLHLNRSLLTP
jgi:formate dehydrogenase subunit delta